MFKELFKSDKAPFVLSLTLTLIGWFISVIVTDISDVIILGVQERVEKQVTVITISNYSIKRSLSKALFGLHPVPKTPSLV
jgi:uncharacterized membrane protein